MANSPKDPFNMMAVGATALHEMFIAYMEAGFTENQALILVGQIVRAAMMQEQEDK